MNEEVLKKIDNLVEKEVVEEAKKYPTQDDAQFVLDWSNNSDFGFALGVLSPDIRKEFDKSDAIRQKLWGKVFGDNSPWRVEMKKNKRVLKYDKDKAERLGI